VAGAGRGDAASVRRRRARRSRERRAGGWSFAASPRRSQLFQGITNFSKEIPRYFQTFPKKFVGSFQENQRLGGDVGRFAFSSLAAEITRSLGVLLSSLRPRAQRTFGELRFSDYRDFCFSARNCHAGRRGRRGAMAPRTPSVARKKPSTVQPSHGALRPIATLGLLAMTASGRARRGGAAPPSVIAFSRHAAARRDAGHRQATPGAARVRAAAADARGESPGRGSGCARSGVFLRRALAALVETRSRRKPPSGRSPA